MRSARTSMIRAFVCEASVTIPAWEPVSEIARWPRSWIAIAHSAHEMRSPEDSSMSISRGSGVVGDLLGHRDQLIGGLAPRREHRDHAEARFALVHDAPRRALDALGVGDRGAAELHHHELWHGAQNNRPSAAGALLYTARRPAKALPRVTSSAYSRSEPTGRPLARRVTVSCGRARAQLLGDVQRGRLAGGRRVGGEHHLAHRPPSVPRCCRALGQHGRRGASSSAIFRSSGSMPSIGESAPPSTW